jgi:hypothetical protein
MSNLQPLRIHAQPESAEQAAQLVAHHTAGAYELIGGAVIGFQTGAVLDRWPFAWPGPDGAVPVRAVYALHQDLEGTGREDLPIETAWTCLCLDPPYATALARVTVTFPSLPARPQFACWIDARQHRPLLLAIADQRRLTHLRDQTAPGGADSSGRAARTPCSYADLCAGFANRPGAPEPIGHRDMWIIVHTYPV